MNTQINGIDNSKYTMFNPAAFLCLSTTRTWISNFICRGSPFRVQWVKMRGDCSFCWYWWNCWLSLFKDEFEDTKGVIRIRKSKTNRQHNGQKKNQNIYVNWCIYNLLFNFQQKIEIQWPKKKGQNDKQQCKKHTHKTKDRETRTPLKSGGKPRCSWRVSSSYSISGTRRTNLITNPVISLELGKDRESVYKWNISVGICYTDNNIHILWLKWQLENWDVLIK
jgi:hypothetical protein